MAENPNAEQLKAIIASLEKPLRLSNQASARRLVVNIVERGWASFADSEDIFYTTDVRLDDMRHDIDVRAWCAMFDVPLVAVYLNRLLSRNSLPLWRKTGSPPISLPIHPHSGGTRRSTSALWPSGASFGTILYNG